MRWLLASALALAACRSSAPYTLPAAALNTGLALGASAAQRSAGGCYASCVGGTVCNPRTGYCESPTAPLVCQEQPGGGLRCAPGSTMTLTQQGEAVRPPPLPLGVSPATGSAPPAPAESSPKPPQ
jgi:hypothetical protein